MKKITLTNTEFNALPEWPRDGLPPPIPGNRWKWKVGGRWHVGGYEDTDGFIEQVYYEDFEVTNVPTARND